MFAAVIFLSTARRNSLAAPPPLMDAAGPTRNLLLDVVVNGNRIGLLGEFSERHGEIYATPAELESLGFRLTSDKAKPAQTGLMNLADLPGVSYRLDEPTQTIVFTVKSDALKPTVIGRQDNGASALKVSSGIGAVVNYDLAGTYADHRALAELFFDGRVFSPWAVAESSFTATNTVGLQAAPVVRLDTTITASDTSTLTQYRAGDVITGGLDWSRPVRLGGFQISTDFGIRPDLMTFPVPTISGAVAIPSSVDVLVNGVQELSQPVPAGPFEIRQLPVVTGLGDVSVVVRNAAGQQSTQTLQLYSSRQLVAPGLDDMSAEIGLTRLNYGVSSNDYRAPAGSFSYRRGLTKWLTLQAHAEASSGGGSYLGLKTESGGMAGGGVVLGLGPLGVVSGNLAGSRFGRRSGGLAAIGFEHIAPHISFSASIQATQGRFGDVASTYGDQVPSVQARAILGFSWDGFGSLGLAFTEQRRPASLTDNGQQVLGEAQAVTREDFGFVPLALATKTSLLSVSYSRPLFGDRVFFSATAYHDFSQSGSSGATVQIAIPLGRRSGASVEADGARAGGDVAAEYTQSAPDIGDAGYQLRAQAGEEPRELAIGTYRAPWGLADLGVDHTGPSTAFRGDLQGAIAVAGGGVFPSLPITDSFAVVDTDGAAGVHVLQENRPVGRTNASGQLLVTDLRAFDANRLGVDPTDIPMDADAGPTSQLIRPRDRSGVVVHFPMTSSHGAVVALRDDAGKPIRLGSRARLANPAGAADLVVGYDGEVYLTGLQAHNRLSVQLQAGGACAAGFDFTPTPGRIPHIGPVVCHAAPP